MKILQIITVLLTIFLMGVFTWRSYNLIDNVTNPPVVSQENTSGSVLWRYGIDKCRGEECERKRIELLEQKSKTDLIIQQTILIDGVILISGVFLFIALGKLSSPRKAGHKLEAAA